MEDPTSVVAERIVRELVGVPSSNSANININAGGVGVWLSATCCAVMLAANVFLTAIVIDHNRQISDLKDYIQVIYQVAPHLKPEEKP